jgi:hypothetical protein
MENFLKVNEFLKFCLCLNIQSIHLKSLIIFRKYLYSSFNSALLIIFKTALIDFFLNKSFQGQKDNLITEKFLSDTQNFLKKKMNQKKKTKVLKKKKAPNNNNSHNENNNNNNNKTSSVSKADDEKLSPSNLQTGKTKTSPIKINDQFLFTPKTSKNVKTDLNLASDEVHGPLTESESTAVNNEPSPLNSNSANMVTITTTATYARSFMKAPHGWLVDFINYFGELNGFQLLLERFKSSVKLNIQVIAALLKPWGLCYQFLTAHTVKTYFLPIIEIVPKFFENLSDEDIKKECKSENKNDSISTVIKWLKLLATRVQNQEELCKNLEILRLKTILRYFEF